MRRLILGLLAAAVVLPSALAQVKEPPKEAKPPDPASEYRDFFKKPENPAEFWAAMQFEIEVGRYDLAAGRLHGLLEYKPSDADLVKLADQHGIAAFLKLRNVRKWYDDPKLDARTKSEVEELIGRVTAAVKKVRGDPKRIAAFIENLLAEPDERAYAIQELAKSGTVAVPYLIEAIRSAPLADRGKLVDALRRMGPETLPPILAALDSNDPRLILDVINIARQRGAEAIVPELWYYSAAQSEPEEVRVQATRALSYFLDVPESKLLQAKVALTREAERYYNHEVRFSNPAAVSVWRWDTKTGRVVEGWPGAPTIPAWKAEEYYGLKYAGEALALDPAYAPAQKVWLSLALDKAQEAAGLGATLDKAAPSAHAMLATVSSDLVNAILERALKEDRVPVILATIRDLGGRAEVRAVRPTTGGGPPLVKALYYPDRRVQLAAAEAIARIPGPPPVNASFRIVDILRRGLAADPGPPVPTVKPKVLLGYFDEDQLTRIAKVVSDLGFEPVKARTGRMLMLRLGEAADIELILMDEELPDPGFVYLLSQLNADRYAAYLPVVVTASVDREGPAGRVAARSPNVAVAPRAILRDPKALEYLLKERLTDPAHPPLTPAELKDAAERSVQLLARLSRGEPAGYDIGPAAAVIVEALRQPSRLRPEGQIAAAEAASHLRGSNPQAVLAEVILDDKRPLAVREKAAGFLIRHIQTFTPVLNRAHVAGLTAIGADPKTDTILKAQVALVLGSLQPNARLTGERLLQYQYQPPAAPAPPAPPKKP
jgi:hypothetical protein